MTVELDSKCFDIDNNGNLFIYTECYEYMFCNGKMYVRPKLNTNNECFDYTDIEELL